MLHHFGSIEPKEVSREINKLGQRDLQVRHGTVNLRSFDVTVPSGALNSVWPLFAGQVQSCIWDADVLQQQLLAATQAHGR